MSKTQRVSPMVAVLSLWLAAWLVLRLDGLTRPVFSILVALADQHPLMCAVVKGLAVGALFVAINGASQRAVRSWRDRRAHPPDGDDATRSEQRS